VNISKRKSLKRMELEDKKLQPIITTPISIISLLYKSTIITLEMQLCQGGQHQWRRKEELEKLYNSDNLNDISFYLNKVLFDKEKLDYNIIFSQLYLRQEKLAHY
jgi:hypothetical protein